MHVGGMAVPYPFLNQSESGKAAITRKQQG